MHPVSDLRDRIITRDNGCMAWYIDEGAGPCYDRWGQILREDAGPAQLEMDYVRLGARGRHHELEVDHVCLCAGHHRGTGPQGGYIWATSHRSELREYLDRLYPR
jgi:hypothetical protein